MMRKVLAILGSAIFLVIAPGLRTSLGLLFLASATGCPWRRDDRSFRNEHIKVDTDKRVAHAQAGCLVGDVDEATQRYGLSTLLDSCPTVGDQDAAFFRAALYHPLS